MSFHCAAFVAFIERVTRSRQLNVLMDDWLIPKRSPCEIVFGFHRVNRFQCCIACSVQPGAGK